MDFRKISNLIVRRALQSRARDFMFNYGDEEGHADHNDRHSESSYEDYYDHTDSGLGRGFTEKKGRKWMGDVGPEKNFTYDDQPPYDAYSDSPYREEYRDSRF